METRNCCGLTFSSTNNRCTSAAMFSAWVPVIRKPIIRAFKFVLFATHPRHTSPNSTTPVAYPPTAYSPPPTAIPMAASTKIVAAVVRPTSPPASRKIAPAPKKPIPCTKFDAMRVADVSPNIFASSKESMVNSAEPMQTKALVRIPAGRRCRSRSMPITAPSNAATLRRKKISCRESIWIARVPLAPVKFYYSELELRQFREVPCSGVYLRAFQRPPALQSAFLHAKAAHHRPVNHRATQRRIAFVPRARQIAHEPPGKAIARSRGIGRLFQRKCRHAEHAARIHQHRPVFPALHHQRRRSHLENVSRGPQQIVLIRN